MRALLELQGEIEVLLHLPQVHEQDEGEAMEISKKKRTISLTLSPELEKKLLEAGGSEYHALGEFAKGLIMEGIESRKVRIMQTEALNRLLDTLQMQQEALQGYHAGIKSRGFKTD